jgi:ligand-binding sensor domain-containing protein/class 3 adenylate cyclase
MFLSGRTRFRSLPGALGLLLAIATGSSPTGSGEGPPFENYRFERISLQEGLSQCSAFCVFQDRQGFLWAGGEYGLNRYDGYGFKLFSHDADDPESLSSNEVRALCEDPAGYLWVGTDDGGLNRFDPSTGKFFRFRHDPRDPASLSGDQVTALAGDPQGSVWVATTGGLDRFPPGAKSFVRYRNGSERADAQDRNRVRALLLDRGGRPWVGTDSGLFRLDPRSGDFTPIAGGKGHPLALPDPRIRCLLEDSDGGIWVGTFGGGLFRFDPGTGTLRPFPLDYRAAAGGDAISSLWQDHRGFLWVGTDGRGLYRLAPGSATFHHIPIDRENPSALSAAGVHALWEDRSQVLWVGTDFGGLNKVDLKERPFRTLRVLPGKDVRSNLVFALMVDPGGDLWMGSHGGLFRFDRRTGRSTRVASDPSDPSSTGSRGVYAIHRGRDGTLWVGTWAGGLSRLDPGSRRFVTYRHDPRDPHSLAGDIVHAVLEDSRGELWVGTWGGGLDRFDRRAGRFVHHRPDPDRPGSLNSDVIQHLFEDREGTLWIGTIGGGLSRFDRDTGTFTSFVRDPGDPSSLSDDRVSFIGEDGAGSLWVGTAGGLNRMDKKAGTLRRFRSREGLPSDAITGVLSDPGGNIWFGHFKGLSRLDPKTGRVLTFTEGDGLPSIEFNSGACALAPDGEMLFGGVNGIVAFHPEGVRTNPHPPAIAVTSFQVFGRERRLRNSPLGAPEVRLSHRENTLTFEFVGLEFTAPEENAYACMLEGLDAEWTPLGRRRYVTYARLPHGHYTFRVKASNNHGLWNEEGLRIPISIAPPFWMTVWFRAASALAFVAALTALYAWRTRSLRLYSLRLERTVVERTADLKQRSDELAREKDRSEGLLRNILPVSIADRLKGGERSIADRFDEVSILFCDLVGFTTLSAELTAEETVSLLNAVFSGFDALVVRLGLEKIKTIGDAYHVVGGMPDRRPDHPERVAEMALGMLEVIRRVNADRGTGLQIRIGFHVGPAVAGVIGTLKFTYDLWGEAVNLASRLESHGEPGRVQVSEEVFVRLRGRYAFEPRGEIRLKGIGPVRTWYMTGPLSRG